MKWLTASKSLTASGRANMAASCKQLPRDVCSFTSITPACSSNLIHTSALLALLLDWLAIVPIAIDMFLRSVVCMPVVSLLHSCILLNTFDRFGILDVGWKVHLWSAMTYCVRWGRWPQERKISEVERPRAPNQNLHLLLTSRKNDDL